MACLSRNLNFPCLVSHHNDIPLLLYCQSWPQAVMISPQLKNVWDYWHMSSHSSIMAFLVQPSTCFIFKFTYFAFLGLRRKQALPPVFPAQHSAWIDTLKSVDYLIDSLPYVISGLASESKETSCQLWQLMLGDPSTQEANIRGSWIHLNTLWHPFLPNFLEEWDL